VWAQAFFFGLVGALTIAAALVGPVLIFASITKCLTLGKIDLEEVLNRKEQAQIHADGKRGLTRYQAQRLDAAALRGKYGVNEFFRLCEEYGAPKTPADIYKYAWFMKAERTLCLIGGGLGGLAGAVLGILAVLG
jgi:hypothetical protein